MSHRPKPTDDPTRPPRSWDHLFGQKADGWVRLRMKSGVWLGDADGEVVFTSPHGRTVRSRAGPLAA